ncbi:uncharacterized protein LOC110924980 [Helianthus annuus]|uniref:uncharacterized protein LOC110924980 n=1 Tax=Helianthus annuus TaxID=4232 RepID=UPI000B8FA2BE|nr:uncharacterized protein LOC110924980 [Helianthus annuus]
MAPKHVPQMTEAEISQLIAQQLQAVIPTIEAQVNTDINANPQPNPQPGPGGQINNQNNVRPICTYKHFMECKPMEFNGTEGPNGLVKWIEKSESVLNISNCPGDCAIKYTACTFTDHALNWWNAIVQSRGQDAINAMTWDDLKILMRERFCPLHEIQKLEHEFWNLQMQGADHVGYTNCFNKLARILPDMVRPESKRIERYIWGLAPKVRSIINSVEHLTMHGVVARSGTVTYDMVRRKILTMPGEPAGNKREAPESSRAGPAIPKRGKATSQSYAMTTPTGNSGGYKGTAPKCNKCTLHHYGACRAGICSRCHKSGHYTLNCKTPLEPTRF